HPGHQYVGESGDLGSVGSGQLIQAAPKARARSASPDSTPLISRSDVMWRQTPPCGPVGSGQLIQAAPKARARSASPDSTPLISRSDVMWRQNPPCGSVGASQLIQKPPQGGRRLAALLCFVGRTRD